MMASTHSTSIPKPAAPVTMRSLMPGSSVTRQISYPGGVVAVPGEGSGWSAMPGIHGSADSGTRPSSSMSGRCSSSIPARRLTTNRSPRSRVFATAAVIASGRTPSPLHEYLVEHPRRQPGRDERDAVGSLDERLRGQGGRHGERLDHVLVLEAGKRRSIHEPASVRPTTSRGAGNRRRGAAARPPSAPGSRGRRTPGPRPGPARSCRRCWR